jgi:hypothetical protein
VGQLAFTHAILLATNTIIKKAGKVVEHLHIFKKNDPAQGQKHSTAGIC